MSDRNKPTKPKEEIIIIQESIHHPPEPPKPQPPVEQIENEDR